MKSNHNRKKSLNNSNILEEAENLYREQPLYKHLKLLFFQIFSEHKLGPDATFDRNVWFLRHNKNFQKIAFDNITIEGPYTEFLKLLEDVSINGKNFSKMNINVKTFIDELCKQILEAIDRKNNAEELMSHYKMNEMKEIIADKLSKERQNLEFFGDTTEVKFSIRQMENFPEGNYSLKLICDTFEDNESHKINFSQISAGILNKRTISLNENDKDEPLKYSEYFETILIKNEKNFQNLELNECYLSRSKFFGEVSYIGILLNSFKICVEKDNLIFAVSDTETMIDTFLNSLDVLLKDKPFKISSSTFATIDRNNKHLMKAGMDKKFVIFYDLEINFNKKIKILILEKIWNIFQDTIITKFENEKLINNFLEYFPDSKEEINNLISENKNEKEICECVNCILF